MRRLDLAKDWEKYDYSKLKVENKSVCIVRYGAFGDLIQASSIFPSLKKQGYHITLNVTEYGLDVIRNDPHIDTLFVQAKDLVPNERLGEYWGILKKQFDKFINLSECVERSLLPIPGDKAYEWHKDFRHLMMNVDYLKGIHAIAGVMDSPPEPGFYPSRSELKWARDYRVKLGPHNKVIMWSLSGSSVHKYYPHMDTVIAKLILSHSEVRIIFVGDQACKILESAWKDEPRIIRKSGKWSIRETLSFMRECDVVIGPETGVMNAASYEPMKKVLILSHSSPDNLGGNWVNTAVVCPENTPCWPCHKLHYGWRTCHYDEKSMGALCAANTSPNEIYNAICEAL